jgi:hypothetical protein
MYGNPFGCVAHWLFFDPNYNLECKIKHGVLEILSGDGIKMKTQNRQDGVLLKMNSEGSFLARDFFNAVGHVVFGKLWKRTDITVKSTTWDSAHVTNDALASDRKRIVEATIVDSLASEEIVAVVSNKAHFVRDIFYDCWLKVIPNRDIAKLLSSHLAPLNKDGISSLIKTIRDERQKKSRPNSDDDESEDDDEFVEADRKLFTEFKTLLQEFDREAPVAADVYISPTFWSSFRDGIDNSKGKSGTIDWASSNILVVGNHLNPELVFHPRKQTTVVRYLENGGVIPQLNESFDRILWKEVRLHALEAFKKQLVDEGRHEFRILGGKEAIELASKEPPWISTKRWGPASDSNYQSFWLTLTAATWRILAVRPGIEKGHGGRKNVMEALNSFLNDQYQMDDERFELPNVSTLYRIVDPVLQQYRNKSESDDLFTGLGQNYKKTEQARKKKPKNS